MTAETSETGGTARHRDGAPVNRLRGEFTAVLAGRAVAFDTTLGTVAIVEDHCGSIPIVEAINRAVFGRRAADGMALIAGALAAMGEADPQGRAARTTAVEAEAFVLALMGALGFEIARRPSEAPATEAGSTDPFAPAPADPPTGAAGAASRSAR